MPVKKAEKLNSKLLDGVLKNAVFKTPESAKIEQILDEMFLAPMKGTEERKGLHASALISESDAEFCFREQILSLNFKPTVSESNTLPTSLLRIFREGDFIHEKWQKMFEQAGVAIGIEARCYSPEFDLYLTPDAILLLEGRKYICEIKSCNTFAYKSFTVSHPKGTAQLKFYMHELAIPRGFVLCEDKNTQEFKVFPVEYKPGDADRPVSRLHRIKKMQGEYMQTQKLPPKNKKCSSASQQRSSKCAFCDICNKFK